MNEEKYICPECGEILEQGDWNYNYDSGLLEFDCPLCGWQGTENELETITENELETIKE